MSARKSLAALDPELDIHDEPSPHSWVDQELKFENELLRVTEEARAEISKAVKRELDDDA